MIMMNMVMMSRRTEAITTRRTTVEHHAVARGGMLTIHWYLRNEWLN